MSDLVSLLDDTEYLFLGDGYMKSCYSIDFCRFMNVRVIDIGKESFQQVRCLNITSHSCVIDMIIRSSSTNNN